ncbi:MULTISPECIES: TetR/AcrR family transcriptional regulator [unclassified Nesterenkonia]|uniref:TetR/AcrR family transcriptional regulator n=1 Tax=unclassified Nesterenkonia TaxID=2629769 RepID=UPI0008728A13|nr:MULTISPECIES: TetR/AcrR family transcriptional regulator [unclassified Nesterenkonia]MDS2171120.1 TetR/AcrR family transcriptional regulator [Nesterenkonia sp. CL21]OSM44118.1 hypothetical protein BCY76_004455 [Nesterenkonia sp. PF2B19]
MVRSPEQGHPRPARERILDAAAQVMREDGLVRATTKLIARTAGCSEALLYKHFPDKRDLFLAVLQERSPRLTPAGPDDGDARERLCAITSRLLEFYAQNFPMAAALFGDRGLLTLHRDALAARGAGPRAPSAAVADLLTTEISRGGISPEVDPDAAAQLLVGAAFHEAFLAAYEDRPLDDPRATAARLVSALRL